MTGAFFRSETTATSRASLFDPFHCWRRNPLFLSRASLDDERCCKSFHVRYTYKALFEGRRGPPINGASMTSSTLMQNTLQKWRSGDIGATSVVLHAAGTLLIAPPEQMGMPEDFYYSPMDRETPSELVISPVAQWRLAAERVRIDSFRRDLSAKVASKAALFAVSLALIFQAGSFGLSATTSIARSAKSAAARLFSSKPAVPKPEIKTPSAALARINNRLDWFGTLGLPPSAIAKPLDSKVVDDANDRLDEIEDLVGKFPTIGQASEIKDAVKKLRENPKAFAEQAAHDRADMDGATGPRHR